MAVMLRAVAEHGTVMAPVQELVRRARRRRRAQRSLTVGGAALALAAAVLVPAALRGTPVVTSVPAGPALTAYRWSAIPPAPIAVRQQSAVVWDGSQVLIWGGQSERSPSALKDGAAYDPATRTWTMLPPSPLSGRWGMASV